MVTETARFGGLPVARRSVGVLLLVSASLLAMGCVQITSSDGGFVMGANITIDEGDVARDDIVAVGGNVRIDGVARRDVTVIGGRLEINGVVERNVTSVGGTLVLGPGARIGRDAVIVAGVLDRHPSARIGGEFVNVSIGTPWSGGHMFPMGWSGWWGFTPFAALARTTQLFYWLILALLTVALVGDRVSSASHAVSREPLRLAAIGLVGIFALCFAFVVLLVLSFVIIGIPFLIALIFVWWLAYIFGLVAVFQSVGNRVMHVVGRPEATQIAIVLTGGLVMGILRYVPLFGTFLWLAASLVGIGSVFATRFGTGRPWVQRRGAAAAAAPPAAPSPGDNPYEPSAAAPAESADGEEERERSGED